MRVNFVGGRCLPAWAVGVARCGRLASPGGRKVVARNFLPPPPTTLNLANSEVAP